MRIGIDLDEVLADSVPAIMRLHNERYGTSHKRADYNSYRYHEIWNVPREEADKRMKEFYDEQVEHFDVVEGSVEALRELKARGHELYIITARPHSDMIESERWLAAKFPGIFTGVHFPNFPNRGPDAPVSKSKVCIENGIELMIDDHMDNVRDCAGMGVKVFVFDQPWNQGYDLPKNATRVSSWDEILSSTPSCPGAASCQRGE